MPVVAYYILMGVLLVMGAFLIVAVLMQHGKDHGLSGTIAGGAETFFGKDKGTRIDRMLGRLTTIVGIMFRPKRLMVWKTKGFRSRYFV